jgi:multidrug efflux pump subunit AcrB
LSASQVLQAVRGQNVQFSAGQVGGEPSPESQMFTATVSAEGRFTNPEQFERSCCARRRRRSGAVEGRCAVEISAPRKGST